MSDKALDQQITSTRRELETTLDELEDKLNVKKQATRLARKARTAFAENPLPFIIGGVAAAVIVAGVVAWAVLSDDD
jgi:CHASE3 domain sensor protein